MRFVTTIIVTVVFSIIFISISNAEEKAKLDIGGILESEFGYITNENDSDGIR